MVRTLSEQQKKQHKAAELRRAEVLTVLKYQALGGDCCDSEREKTLLFFIFFPSPSPLPPPLQVFLS